MAEDEDSTSSDSTDVLSDKFDSLKALYSSKLRVPVPDAPLFDNINKFESVVLKGIKPSDKQASTSQASKGVNIEPTERFPFLKETENTKGNESRRQRYAEKNVISRMQKYLGPLAVLYQYMENRTRVKVYTRSISGIRGHIEAYVAAFDRHWNLALEDCLESWSRKIKRKAPASGGLVAEKNCKPEPECKLIVKQTNGKLETLERHVPQLLIRGEQVVLISKID
ncbi:U7 snRNA-associated Sm-like protein LSm11 [Copidosoma floridanum]|uniref:U7 snRNA-associated Sm-like protein LSm11 n=1 Tax=Copidosoma floridanum TaxID=29053 RepID=UPI0006C987EC|nr:U7 snRNA-associated Sm-like protein LSm11 [Copidosoma floridanum]